MGRNRVYALYRPIQPYPSLSLILRLGFAVDATAGGDTVVAGSEESVNVLHVGDAACIGAGVLITHRAFR